MTGSTLQRKPKSGRRIMDPEERAAFRKQRQSEDRERIAAAVAELATSEGWARYVEARSRFHTYSPANCMLIALQAPEASYVAGFHTWKSLGRSVRKGQHGIRILAPCPIKVAKNTERAGVSNSSTIAQSVAAGRKTYEEGASGDFDTRMMFKSVAVFDVSQTDGEPLPELPREPITGDSHARHLPQLEEFAHGLGFAVDYRDMSGSNARGYCRYDTHEIVVDSTAPANARVRVLVHELAHAMGVSSKQYGREDAEVIVESVAVIVLGALGLDTSGESIPYVAGWGAGDVAALKQYAETVDELATRLETALEIR